jgi:hypothetical protein
MMALHPWARAERWVAGQHERSARVLEVDAGGLLWDAEGFFAPQRADWSAVAAWELRHQPRPRDRGRYVGPEAPRL